MATTVDPASLIPVRYYGSDPDGLLQEMIDDLRALYGTQWSNFLQGGHGMILLRLFSRALWRVIFQADRNVSDSYAATVRLRRAGARLAKQLGYNPRGASSAGTDLTVGLGATYGFDVTLPSGFEFQGPDATTWRTSQAYVWTAGDVAAKSVTVTEGTERIVTYVSDGSRNQRFFVPLDRSAGEQLRYGGVTVRIAGVGWTEKGILPYETGNYFEVFYTTDLPEVWLGNGSAGNVPSSGAVVEIAYVVSRGAAGNVPAGKIVQAVRDLVVGTTAIELTISQAKEASGGLAEDGVQQAALLATGVHASRGVAVTADDYAAQAVAYSSARYGRAAVAKALSLRGAGMDGELAAGLQAVRDEVHPRVTTLEAAVAALGTIFSDLGASRGKVETASDAIALLRSGSVLLVLALGTDLTTADTELVGAGGFVSAFKSQVDAVTTGGSDQLTAATKNALKGLADSASQDVTDARNKIATAKTGATSLSTNLLSEDAEIAKIEAEVASTTGVQAVKLSAAQTERSKVDGVSDVLGDDLEPALQRIYDHVDLVLAHDAKANVVQIHLLGRDADGFFAAPSRGLLRSVGAHLETIKEPQVTVEMVDGSAALVAWQLEVSGTYELGTVVSDLEAEIGRKLKDATKAKSFGETGWLWDLYDALEGIDGLHKATVKIVGPVQYLDDDGNLAIPADKVITWGTLSVSLKQKTI